MTSSPHRLSWSDTFSLANLSSSTPPYDSLPANKTIFHFVRHFQTKQKRHKKEKKKKKKQKKEKKKKKKTKKKK
ncbi:hypothetical protein, partial [Escherichia coli]|uniref:hypothetical protein n=1 Tax=Escherichia coli TaxID=562 RepID=UPI001BAEBE25